MSAASRPGALAHLLDLSDELRALRKRSQDPDLKPSTRAQHRKKLREKLRELASDLESHAFRGRLRARLAGLGPDRFLVLTTLLRHYLRSPDPWLEGRELLGSVFGSSYELLRGLELLQPEELLVQRELVDLDRGENDEPEGDLLENRFRLSESVVDDFLAEVAVRKRKGKPRPRSYASQRAYLVDLKYLHNLCRERAKRLFSPETFWRAAGQPHIQVLSALERRIGRAGAAIERRLSASPGAAMFPILALCREARLSQSELIVVVSLLLQEFLEGNPYVDTVSLVQLVSRDEQELYANRGLFAPEGRLRSRGVVELEPMLEGRDLTSECSLTSWAVDRILSEEAGDRPIGADEKLDFHLFLKRLGSSSFLGEG